MTTQAQPEWFHNKGSYDAFIYAVTLVEKIKYAQRKGAKIFDEGGLMTGEWVVSYDPENPSVEYIEGCSGTLYVGAQWDTRSGKVYCTKKELKEAFGGVYWVHPEDFYKLV